MPFLKNFYSKYGIQEQYKHWLTAKFKLTKARIFMGGIAGSMPICKIEASIYAAEFLQDKINLELPDISQVLSGDGVYYSFCIYPTHKVKPFKICFRCQARNIEPGKGWFFCRAETYTLCQTCGLVEMARREDPKLCPPFKQYLYFKFPIGGNDFDDKLQVLPQEDFNASVRDKSHAVTCASCRLNKFVGIRFKCAVCSNVDVCEKCMVRMVKNGGTDPVAQEVYSILKGVGCCGVKDHVFLAVYLNNTF